MCHICIMLCILLGSKEDVMSEISGEKKWFPNFPRFLVMCNVGVETTVYFIV